MTCIPHWSACWSTPCRRCMPAAACFIAPAISRGGSSPEFAVSERRRARLQIGSILPQAPPAVLAGHLHRALDRHAGADRRRSCCRCSRSCRASTNGASSGAFSTGTRRLKLLERRMAQDRRGSAPGERFSGRDRAHRGRRARDPGSLGVLGAMFNLRSAMDLVRQEFWPMPARH